MIEPPFYTTPFFDLNRVPGNGLLIFPLSMGRLHAGQDPKTLYDFIKFFETKITEKTVDVIFLYTNGLYFNSPEESSATRKKTNSQMLTHKQEFLKIIKKKNEFSESAFYFLPWDYVLLQAEKFLDLYALLQQLKTTDMVFKRIVEMEIKDDIFLPENYDFIIEETIVTYLIRQKFVRLPHTLSRSDGWRLIVYAGNCLLPDVYIH